MNKNNLKLGTRVTFYPVDGAAYSFEGTIIARKGKLFTVRCKVGEAPAGTYQPVKDWACRPSDIISVEPKPGAWGQI